MGLLSGLVATAWPGAQRRAAGPSLGYQLVWGRERHWSGGSDPSELPLDATLAAWLEHMSPLLQPCFLACFLINNLFLSFLTLMFIDV